MELTLKTFLDMSEETFNEEITYSSHWGSGTRAYTASYECDDSLFYQLNERFPQSGINDFFIAAYKKTFDSFLEDKSKGIPEEHSVLSYFKAYSLYPQISVPVKNGLSNIVLELLRIHPYWRMSSQDIDFKNIKKTFKSGETIEEVLQIPSFAIDSFKRTSTKTEWNNLRIAFKKYIPDEKTYNLLKSVSGYNFSKFANKCKTLLNSGYYTLESLMQYVKKTSINTHLDVYTVLDMLNNYITACKSSGVIPDITPNDLRTASECSWRIRSINDEYYQTRYESRMTNFIIKNYTCGNYTFNVPKNLNEIYDYARILRNSASLYVSENKKIILVSEGAENKPIAVLLLDTDQNMIILEKYNQSCNEELRSAAKVFHDAVLEAQKAETEMPF